MGIEIKPLTPDLEAAYFDFFDRRAFSDGSPNYPCYCNAYNLSAGGIEALREQALLCGGGIESWKRTLRESTERMVREGKLLGYLAFEGDEAIGWCNANDRMAYYRVGAFDLDRVPEDRAPMNCARWGQVKSVVCFEIAPTHRGRGVATRLLERACSDARAEGYDFVEAYPTRQTEPSLAFTGPVGLYEKLGFTEFARDGEIIVMRRAL